MQWWGELNHSIVSGKRVCSKRDDQDTGLIPRKKLSGFPEQSVIVQATGCGIMKIQTADINRCAVRMVKSVI